MANPYFQFKQFTVYQDKCAMKVCTDACLFGAVVARYCETGYHEFPGGQLRSNPIKQILDVGSGTGLLSLMLAQKTKSTIAAIEINGEAYSQSIHNIRSSPWKERIHVAHTDFTTHHFDKKYDLVISNPPFFKSHLRSPDHTINLARHSDALQTEDLIRGVAELVATNGSFAVLIPYEQSASFIKSASNSGLYLNQHLAVRQTDKHPFFRSILFFGLLMPEGIMNKEMYIKKDDQYSDEFADLLKDYYLSL